jgi:hypothetical protein
MPDIPFEKDKRSLMHCNMVYVMHWRQGVPVKTDKSAPLTSGHQIVGDTFPSMRIS